VLLGTSPLSFLASIYLFCVFFAPGGHGGGGGGGGGFGAPPSSHSFDAPHGTGS